MPSSNYPAAARKKQNRCKPSRKLKTSPPNSDIIGFQGKSLKKYWTINP